MSLTSRSLRFVGVGIVAAVLGSAFVPTAASAASAAPDSPTDFTALVNSFVSTEDDFGQDLPGAEAPNSIIKINPMTTPGRSHSGYDYAESRIAGFTHTNLNGVGGSGGGGDLLVVPTYETYTSKPSTGTYAKPYSHDAEKAEPGYYGVELQTSRGAILAEATTDVRTGQDRFTFPQAGTASVVVDLRNNFTSRRDAAIQTETLADGRVALSGEFMGHFNGYDYRMYYYAESTSAASSVRTWGSANALTTAATQTGTDIGAVLQFDVAAGQEVGLKVAISPISAAQAEIDLGVEMGERSFDQVRAETKADWNEILGRLEVTASAKSDPTGDLSELFYTHLYRMFGAPVNATSTSGTYRGLDGEIHTAEGYTHYDGWGFWDDFRKYEVLAVGYPEVFRDMAQSIVDLYATFAKTGKGSLSNAVHSVPTVRFERTAVVVADAVAKGAQLRDLDVAWPALVSQSQGGYGNADNVRNGYIANEVDDTLGTAYDDVAMATIADALGRTDEAAAYRLRAANWTNLFKSDAVTLADGSRAGLVFPKNAGGAWANVDPERFEAGNVYQGTLWQYNWYVAPDMGGMIEKMGGEAKTRDALSFMFGEHAPNDGSRMLHANANEIDLQAPYLFNYVGAPSRTQYWARNIYTAETWNRYIATGSTHESPSGNGEFTPPIKTKVYKNSPQGFLPTMDNDTGTMSSMFVAAAIGLFPVAAGSDEYQIGSPFFENVRISYESGRSFDIAAEGVSPEAYYIQSAQLNGESFDRTWVTYDQITGGGRLAFTMGTNASEWAADGIAAPSLSDVLPSSVYNPTSAVSVASRQFRESGSGDGSIENTIALNISNGTFAGAAGTDLAASGAITAANLPAGLTLSAVRAGERSVTLALTGKAAASNEFDSIDDLVISVSDAAFSRKPSTGSREFTMKVTFQGATLTAERTALLAAADGTVDTTVSLTLSGATFAGAEGRDLVADAALAVPGLPAGVTATATKRSASTIDLRLTGSLGAASTATFALAFTDAALRGVTAAQLRGDGVSGLGVMTLSVDREWKRQLASALAEADLVERGAYSTATFTAFAAARDAARAVLADEAATEGAVRSALDALNRAAAALRIAAATDRAILDGVTYGTVAFDDDFSTDRLGEYTTRGDVSEAAADLIVDTTAGVLTATSTSGRRWSHIELPTSTSERFAIVVEPKSFAATGDFEDSMFIGVTNGAGNRVHSWFNNTRSETGFDAVVGGQGVNLGAGNQGGVAWQPGDRLATVIDNGQITSWMERGGVWTKLRSASISPALTAEQLKTWKPTVSLRLDPGVIALDRVTVLRADEAAAVVPARIEAESFASSSGGSLVAEGTSPTGNVGGTYDGGELTYDAAFGTGPLTTVTVRSSTRDERVGANPRLEFYLDDKTPGNRIASVALPKTGGWGNYVTTTVDLERPVSGRHTLIVVMRTDRVSGQEFHYVSNFDWWEFAPAPDAQQPADRGPLQAAVVDAEQVLQNADRYIAIDLAVFRLAFDEASRVAQDAAASQGQVDETLRVLTAAQGQLVWKVVRTLPLLIAEAEAIVRDGYSEKTLAALDAALVTARGVEAGATYEVFTAAYTSLQQAISGLAAPEQPGTDPEEPGTDPEEPGTDPEEPGTDPEEPGTDPEEPGTEEPGTEEPGTEQPGNPRPGFTPGAPSIDGSDLPLVFRDVITVAVSGRQLTVTGLGADAWNFGYVYSTPQALGWTLADGAGRATYTLPTGMEAGVHRLAVLNTAGGLVGWTEFRIDGSYDLPATGGEATLSLLIGGIAGALILVGVVLFIRRRRTTAS